MVEALVGWALSLEDSNRVAGQSLQSSRQDLGIEVEILADILGIPAQDLHDYEAGLRDIPVAVLHRAALFFQVSLDFFFDLQSLEYF